MKGSFPNQYDQIENDFQDDIEETLNDILGEKASSSQKEELYDTISSIFSKYSDKYYNRLTQILMAETVHNYPLNIKIPKVEHRQSIFILFLHQNLRLTAFNLQIHFKYK